MAIRIDPDIMNQRAGQYRIEAQNIGRVMSSMDNLMRNLQMEWEGEASRSYETRYFSEVKPNLQKVQQLIEDIAQSLDTVAAEMRERDAMMAATLRK